MGSMTARGNSLPSSTKKKHHGRFFKTSKTPSMGSRDHHTGKARQIKSLQICDQH